MISVPRHRQRIILSREPEVTLDNFIIITNYDELILTNFDEIVVA